jgi:hypothetical protein
MKTIDQEKHNNLLSAEFDQFKHTLNNQSNALYKAGYAVTYINAGNLLKINHNVFGVKSAHEFNRGDDTYDMRHLTSQFRSVVGYV